MAPGVRTAFAIITLLLCLSIGVMIFAQINHQTKSIAQDLNDTQVIDFVDESEEMGFNALKMVQIGAIVMGAVFILGLLGFVGGGGDHAI